MPKLKKNLFKFRVDLMEKYTKLQKIRLNEILRYTMMNL